MRVEQNTKRRVYYNVRTRVHSSSTRTTNLLRRISPRTSRYIPLLLLVGSFVYFPPICWVCYDHSSVEEKPRTTK